MKNQNQNFSSKRYHFYYNSPDWEVGIVQDTNSRLSYGCDSTDGIRYALQNCDYGHTVEGNFVEFNSVEELYAKYPELFI